MRGGENVISDLFDLYPNADLFTHVYDCKSVSEKIASRNISTTFIQNLPSAKNLYQNYLPLMPLALEQLDLRSYDLVISSESGPAKGVLTSPECLHICYCHTPMRYLWDMYHDYKQQVGFIKRLVMVPLIHYLRLWDVTSAQRVDLFIANSNYVAKRIWKIYRREAKVIYPPVHIENFILTKKLEDFYLFVGHLSAYKRADLAVKAFNKLGKRLVVIGEGEQFGELKKIGKANIDLMGWQPISTIKEYYAKCRALIFPGKEDFGIVPVESMASGRPVIAFGDGGALETIVQYKTGIFFDQQSVEKLIEAVYYFEKYEQLFKPEVCIKQAMKFSSIRFKEEFKEFIDANSWKHRVV